MKVVPGSLEVAIDAQQLRVGPGVRSVRTSSVAILLHLTAKKQLSSSKSQQKPQPSHFSQPVKPQQSHIMGLGGDDRPADSAEKHGVDQLAGKDQAVDIERVVDDGHCGSKDLRGRQVGTVLTGRATKGGVWSPAWDMAKGRETGSICSRRDWTRGLRKSSVASEQAKSTDPAEWAAGSARLSFV